MRKTRNIPLLLSLLASTACTLGPDFVHPVPALPATWQTPGVAPTAPPLANAAWWHAFNDPVLDSLEEQAGGSNLDVRVGIERIEASRAMYGAARAERSPVVLGQVSYSRQRIGTEGVAAIAAPLLGLSSVSQSTRGLDFDVYSLGAGASWELDLWGKRRRQIEGAKASLEAADAAARGVRLSVQAEVARTYFQLRGLWAERAFAGQRHALAGQAVAIARALLTRGLATSVDVVEAQSRQRRVDNDIADLDNQAASAARALAVLIGADPETMPVDREAIYTLPLPAAPALRVPSELARRRPDIVVAEKQLHAATAAIGVAQADFYPVISLTGTFSLDVLDLSSLGWGARNTSIGPSLSLPVFNGGRIQRQLDLRRAEQRGAALSYQKVVRNAWREVDDALGTIQSLETRGVLAQAEVDAQQQTTAALEARYRRGDIDAVRLLQAREALAVAQNAQIHQRVAALLARVQLQRALGG